MSTLWTDVRVRGPKGFDSSVIDWLCLYIAAILSD